MVLWYKNVLRTSKYEGGSHMNEIIKNIEAAQLKENAPEFHVGDTVKVFDYLLEWED